MTVDILVRELEEIYPNDIFKLENLSDSERDEYITKMKMIEEMKIGVQ